MGDTVFSEHRIHIRRIELGSGWGIGYEIHVPSDGVRLNRHEFRKMILDLVDHLMRVGSR